MEEEEEAAGRESVSATSVRGLELLVYEALSNQCMRP